VTGFRKAAITATLTASLMLGGCVTLLPKTKPAQLYQFGQNVGASAERSSTPVAGPIGLRLSTGFTRASESDRILTVSGPETAYIAEARWISPASVMFDEAASRAFEGPGSPFRVLRRSDIGSGVATLRIDVERFEADYPSGFNSTPSVVVRVRALLNGPNDHGLPRAMEFTSTKPAGQNRVGEIVGAFDAATADVLSQVATWSASQVAG
jgi:cholesterol transport system auxiliary component